MRLFRFLCAILGLFALELYTVNFSDAQPAVAPGPEKKPEKPSVPDPPPGTILTAGEFPIDLGTTLRLAGVQNPELLLMRQRTIEATAVRQLAAAQILPNINVGSNIDMHVGPLQSSNGTILKVNRDAMYVGLGTNAIAAGSVNIPGISYNLNVGVAWYDWLRSRQMVVRASAESAATELDIFLRTTLAYSELLRMEGRRAVALRNREEVAEVARLTAAYAKAGQGRKADADRAAVELKRRDMELTQAEGDILSASARLCQLLSLDPSTRLKPIDGWVVPNPVVPDPIPLSELIVIALMQRPELAARRAEIQEALYGLANARMLPFSPNVILGFSAGSFGGGSNLVASGVKQADGSTLTQSRFGTFDARTDLDAVVYWTLQNLGVGNVAIIRGARSRLRQTELRQLDSLNRIRTEVAEAHARTHARYAQIVTMEKAVLASQEAFKEDLTRIKGREGLPIEVIDSLRLLSRSRNEYLDAIIDYNRAHFQLYAAVGRPPAAMLARPIPTDLVPAPKPADPKMKPDAPTKP